MEKKEINTGIYETTYSGGVFVGELYTPTKKGLTDQMKAALLKYLTESDEFHKLVCDITGVERKQEKISTEPEKLKEEYSHMCESYEHEKHQRNDLLYKWREETAKRLDAERERDFAQRHHKFVMNELSSILKEVECSSVRGIVDELKAARLRGKVLEEDNESIRRDCERLKLNYDKVCKEKEKSEKAKYEIEKKYNTDFEYLNKCNQNQAKTITNQMNDLLKLKKELETQKDLVNKYVAKSEKLQSKLDKASRRYGELIKIISDRAIKSV